MKVPPLASAIAEKIAKNKKGLVLVLVVVVVVVVVVVSLAALSSRPGHGPHGPHNGPTGPRNGPHNGPRNGPTDLHDEESRIFVSVASYRDKLCGATLASMFAMARNPARVFAGVYEQNADDSESCVGGNLGPGAARCDEASKWRSNVRLVTVGAEQAKGPCAARYRCSLLLRDEPVFLQIDSHTEFARDWDVGAVRMLREVPGARQGKVVISTYPVNCDTGWESSGIPVIDKAKYSGGWVTFEATIRGTVDGAVDGPDGTPGVPSRQIGGGFMLCVADVVRRVPFDPGLDGVFNNEEALYTARLFTHGIDVVAPRRNLVCHNYFYQEHRVPWNDRPDWNKDTRGNERVDSLLLGKNEDQFGKYGMGTARSLSDFWAHVNIDYAHKTVGAWPH